MNRRDIARRSRNQTGRQPDSTQRPQRVSKRVAEEKLSLRDSAPTFASSALKKSSPNATKLADSTTKDAEKTAPRQAGSCSLKGDWLVGLQAAISLCVPRSAISRHRRAPQSFFGLRWQAQRDTALGPPAALAKRRGAALPAAVQNALVAAPPRYVSAVFLAVATAWLRLNLAGGSRDCYASAEPSRVRPDSHDCGLPQRSPRLTNS